MAVPDLSPIIYMKVTLKEREYDSGNSQLYLYYSSSGKRIKEPLGIHISAKDSQADRNKKLALGEAVRIEREHDLQFSKHKIYNPERRYTSFFEFMDWYLDNHGNRQKNLGVRKHLTMLYPNGLTFQEMDESACQHFYDYLKTKTGSDTPNMYFSCLRTMLKTAVKQKFITINPAANIEFTVRVTPEVKKEIPSDKELRELERTPCKDDIVKRAMLVSSRTGFGVAELRTLTGSSIDKHRMQITAHRQKNKGRGMMPVTVPITAKVLKWLGPAWYRDKQIFILPYKNVIQKVIKKWCIDAGIKKHLTSYSFRHAYATRLLNAGAAESTVANALGHASTKMVKRYAKTDEQLRKLVNKIK